MRLLPIIVLAAGCDPCAGFDGPEFVEVDGSWPEGQVGRLQGVYDDFMRWTGSEEVCIDEIALQGNAGRETTLWSNGFGSWRIRIDPEAQDADRQLRLGLCTALDLQEHITEEHPEMFWNSFLGDGSATGLLEEFAVACAEGPAFDGFARILADACGGDSGLTGMQDFVARSVYPHAPDGVAVGALGVTPPQESVAVGVLEGGRFVRYAPAGAQLAVHLRHSATSRHEAETSVSFVEPSTGAWQSVLRVPVEYGDLYGGTDAVLVDRIYEDHPRFHRVDSETRAVTHTGWAENRFAFDVGAVDGDRLLLADRRFPGALYAFDLASGASSPLALPPADGTHLWEPLVLVAFEEGMALLSRRRAYDTHESGERFPVAGGGEFDLHAYDERSEAWTLLLADTMFIPLGETDGLVLGEMYVGNRWLIAAWDLEASQLRFAPDICSASAPGEPFALAGRTLVHLTWDESDLALRTWEISRE